MRFLVGLLATILLASGCAKAQPDPEPIPSPDASLSPRLLNWAAPLERFGVYWATLPSDRPLRLAVSSAGIIEIAELQICQAPPAFDPKGPFLQYCRAAMVQNPPQPTPDGVVLVPYEPFTQSLLQWRAKYSEDILYETLVVLLALFYADHLIDEGERVGLLEKGTSTETHRYCLAGALLQADLGPTVARRLVTGGDKILWRFIWDHRQPRPSGIAENWLTRGINSGGRLEANLMCT